MDASSTEILQSLLEQRGAIGIDSLIVSLILAGLAGFIIAKFYEIYGTSLSNRRFLSKNFVPLCVTTALVITVIKGSITLSLGLVGALSIVRFRTAIKEPEELAFIFLVIAAGIGLGAGQPMLTFASLSIILPLIYIERNYTKKKENLSENNMYLNFKIRNFEITDFQFVLDLLDKDTVNLKRFDRCDGNAELVFLASALDEKALSEITKSIDLNDRIDFSCVEQQLIY